MVATLVSPLSTDGGSGIRETLQQVVRDRASVLPRTLQQAVGPSEIGDDCQRRIAYRLMGLPGPNNNGDPWPSIVGTAVHAWLADAFLLDNERLGRIRWLVEQRVYLTDGISGTCDLYDCWTHRIIDHKILGTTSMSKIKRGEIPDRYRVQTHLYGYGYRRAGFPVQSVALACFPRGGFLDGLHIWSEPYDESVAEEALDRLGHLTTAAVLLQLDEPDSPHWSKVPHRPGPGCAWCPMWRPGQPADTQGCPGPDLKARPGSHA